MFLFLSQCLLSAFGQGDTSKYLTFDFHEIQVFTGLTINGTHSLILDNYGLTMRNVNFSDVAVEVVNFRELKAHDLRDFRKNYTELLKYLNEFNYKGYSVLTEKKEVRVLDGDTLLQEHLIPSNDLGTRILFIDNDFESYFIRYYLCEEQLDELIKRINKLIPVKSRKKYSIRLRCK